MVIAKTAIAFVINILLLKNSFRVIVVQYLFCIQSLVGYSGGNFVLYILTVYA